MRHGWDPAGRDFDSITFECIISHALGQITVNLTRGSMAEREDAIREFPLDSDRKKTKHWPSVQRAWCAKKPLLTLHAITDEEGRPLDTADDSGAR